MDFMSVREAADKWRISQRRVAVLCSENRIDNATMVGNMWFIPVTAEKPINARSIRDKKIDEKKVKPFLKWAGEIYCQDENGGYMYRFDFGKYPLNSHAHYERYAYFMEHTGY